MIVYFIENANIFYSEYSEARNDGKNIKESILFCFGFVGSDEEEEEENLLEEQDL